MRNVSKEDAVKMANWWAEQITNPNQNMGTEKQGGNEMGNLLGTLLAASCTPNDEQVNVFRDKLSEIIVTKGVSDLSVDYGPDMYLSEAAEYAGINPNCFPWKSSTYITSAGEIIAKRGYGSTGERI